MTADIKALISEIHSGIHSLLYDEVIQHTIAVMIKLRHNLDLLASMGIHSLTEEEKEELKKILLPLISESIREALHKSELPITNGIIRSKNKILTTLGVVVPDDHKEIDAKNYPNYKW